MRIAIGIEYDGTAYNGWQRQKTGTGVQELVENALSSVANEAVEVVCAGRTDAGVHATGQVIHFDTRISRSERGWLLGANSNLPADINARWVSLVGEDFHARYAATSRTYRYLILNRLTRSALYRHRAWWVHQPLDEGLMQHGAGYLLGEHDFSAFRAAGCQASTAVRKIFAVTVRRQHDWVSITLTANAFLQHMVRNIAGLLTAIGNGGEKPDWAARVLASRDRTAGGVAAPAHGLTLVSVDYPAQFALPDTADFLSPDGPA
ncbi:MAG: tRNA pseudouridine(38-40) synthase TruA [Gammaproteobacteria bacterium]|nr:tRNA pseudouridine(38-40) synthase TruA [Gammaproteobacteria bacterium]